MIQEHRLIGRITGLQIFKLPEFGTRASFRLTCSGQYPRDLLCRRGCRTGTRHVLLRGR